MTAPFPAAGRATMLGRLSMLIITSFMDMIGVLMIIPLIPYYAKEVGANGLLLGVLVSSYTAAQLLSAPLWGRVSDKHGRRPALLISLAGATIAYFIFAFSTSFWLLLLSRVVQGAGGGTTGVINAYVSDSVEPRQRARALGWLSAASNAGVALGPPIGSLALLKMGRPGPGIVAGILCIVNMVFVWKFLAESHQPSSTKVTVKSFDAFKFALTNPRETGPRLIWMYGIAIGAFQGTTAILAFLLYDNFNVGADRIWILFTYIGVISVISRVGVLGRAVDRYGEIVLARVGLLLLAVGLSALPIVTSIPALALAVALMPLGTAFTFPCITSLLSRVINKDERGVYMGVQHTFGGISRVIVPLWAGFAYDSLGKGVPFWTSSVLALCVLSLSKGITADGPEMQSTTIG